MQFADAWADGALATIGTMALQLQEAHQIIKGLNEQYAELSSEVEDLKAELGIALHSMGNSLAANPDTEGVQWSAEYLDDSDEKENPPVP